MKLLVLLTATVVVGHCQEDEKVSFYGASYIHYPVQEAKGSTDLSFRFRTHLPDTILILAAGKTDYCLLKLDAGRLKVHINLGAGESEIASAHGLTLNDLTWHEVNLERRDANIMLQIDVIHTTKYVLPGKFFELNVHFGVYIGGQGNFNELFLGHAEYFRGCMAAITYNGVNVIEYAKSRRSKAEAVAVSWGCSREFDATKATEMSFVDVGAFISINRLIPKFGLRWECALKTVADSGMLLYNAGHTPNADYLGIELHEGKIHAVINKGNSLTEFMHSTTIGDGEWHNVSVNFNPNTIEINVDNLGKRINLSLSGSRYLDPGEVLYVGGTSLNKRAKLAGKGFKTGDQSYNGCLRGMLFNGQPVGLPDVKVSQGILAGCVWKYPCMTHENPCLEGATCDQLGVSAFQCLCRQQTMSSCTRADNDADKDKVNAEAILPVSLELLALTQLKVYEGGSGYITSEILKIVLDIAKYGMSDNGVIFSVNSAPKSGTLLHGTIRIEKKSSFTLRDVNQREIQYIHDGGESTEDIMILELQLRTGMGYKLPRYLEGRLAFPLYVNITPVNDQPVLNILANKVLRLAQGTKKTLNTEIICTMDVDTPSEMLKYLVLKADKYGGHLERLHEPGRRVETFTQAELEHGTIAYVDWGIEYNDTALGLQVSDGVSSSPSRSLSISTYPLQINVSRNTGLVVIHRSFAYLRSSNISFTTNSDDTSIEICFDIIRLPEYGVIQISNDVDDQWEMTDHFNSTDVKLERIRYLHTIGSPSEDAFEFRVSVRAVKPQQNYHFKITFIHLELTEIRNIPVHFSHSLETALESQSLSFQTKPLVTYLENITYTIASITTYGYLILGSKIIRDGDAFSQVDVDLGRLKYRLLKKSYSAVADQFTFVVRAPQCQPITSNFSIRYHTGGHAKAFVERLIVVEGSKVPLRIVLMHPKNFGVTQLIYNITNGPSHGWLTVQCSRNEDTRVNTTYFVTDELTDENVYYHHDDSETCEDFFTFVATSTDDTDFMYVGQFHIEVALQNDNPPERSDNRSFHVVSYGERPITSNDLTYTDKDTSTKDSDILYSKIIITNGGIYNIDNTSLELKKFTQQDVNDGRILFRHRGEYVGNFEFTVSDGRWKIKGVLAIRASAPYVQFRESKAIVVRFNGSVTLGLTEIDVQTNIYANDEDMTFSVRREPKYGILVTHFKKTNTFTREDLRRGSVSYNHSGISLVTDNIQVQVKVGEASSDSRLMVKVYPEIYWEQLVVRNNKSIYVEETTSVIVNRESLEIVQSNVSSSEIIYYLREWPNNGYIEIQYNGEERSDEAVKEDDNAIVVQQFDQSMVNEGRVYYVQSVSNQTQDSFVVDVTNGVTWSRGLIVNFVTVPDRMYVETSPLTVVEGKSVVLTTSHFHVMSTYFADKITNYEIISTPEHGIVTQLTPNRQIYHFSPKHLSAKVIFYRHNGDESPTDKLKLIITAGNKTSQAIDLWVHVELINDEIPVLVNHSIENVWQGGSTILTSKELASIDNDTSSKDLQYNVTKIRNGFLWYADSPDIHIYNFAQAQIDESKIIFTHTNGSEAALSFFLYDGVHVTKEYEVPVIILPVHLHTIRNNLLRVFPHTRKLVSAMQLLTTCSDLARDVRYIVRKAPKLGHIMVENSKGNWQQVNHFTQKDINASKVSYEHTKPFMDLSTNDSLVFDVEAPFAGSILDQVFLIDVSISSGALNRHISAKTLHVEEGGSSPVVMKLTGIVKYLQINAGINKPVILLTLLKQPSHGHVMVLPNLNVTTFTQLQIEGEQIVYTHDHSDTVEDKIVFSIALSPGHVMLCNTSVPVVISPINDEPFNLMTTEPSITVVQNQTQTITREDLLTTDPDTGPEGIVYDLISGPNYGRLLLSSLHSNAALVQQVTQWTQQDINGNRLVYQHNGSTQTVSFYFRVSDNSFNPIYKVFIVHVLPIKIRVALAKPVSLLQGSKVAYISEENVKLDTNAGQEHVTYEITRPPVHGNLYVRDVAAGVFSHGDLLAKGVAYIQTDMTVSNDSFDILARVSNVQTNNMTIGIKVAPLIITKAMNVVAGATNLITREYMDATPLYEMTHSNPVYRLTRKLKYCKLKRIIRRSGEKRGSHEREVLRFTHLEIVSRVMFIVCQQLRITEANGVPDSFDFTLATPSYQPATGRFEVTIGTSVDNRTGTLSRALDKVEHKDRMATPLNISNDYIVFYGMVPSFILLAITVIVTIKYKRKKYKHNRKNKLFGGTPAIKVIPLPRPPDHLIPPTQLSKNFDGNNSSVMASTPLPAQPIVTSTLPQCTVIPLTINAIDSTKGSEADTLGKCPYDHADGEEWNSFDTGDVSSQTASTERTNPILQRNQYWV